MEYKRVNKKGSCSYNKTIRNETKCTNWKKSLGFFLFFFFNFTELQQNTNQMKYLRLKQNFCIDEIVKDAQNINN